MQNILLLCQLVELAKILPINQTSLYILNVQFCLCNQQFLALDMNQSLWQNFTFCNLYTFNVLSCFGTNTHGALQLLLFGSIKSFCNRYWISFCRYSFWNGFIRYGYCCTGIAFPTSTSWNILLVLVGIFGNKCLYSLISSFSYSLAVVHKCSSFLSWFSGICEFSNLGKFDSLVSLSKSFSTLSLGGTLIITFTEVG